MSRRSDDQNERPMRAAVLNGLRCRCPRCGEGKLYARYLEPVSRCSVCGEPFGDEYQVGLLLPFIVITVLGHIVVFALLELSRQGINPLVTLTIVLPATLVASLLLLPPVKGALIGLLWSRNLSDQEE